MHKMLTFLAYVHFLLYLCSDFAHYARVHWKIIEKQYGTK